jgi:hypothetical protein
MKTPTTSPAVRDVDTQQFVIMRNIDWHTGILYWQGSCPWRGCKSHTIVSIRVGDGAGHWPAYEFNLPCGHSRGLNRDIRLAPDVLTRFILEMP